MLSRLKIDQRQRNQSRLKQQCIIAIIAVLFMTSLSSFVSETSAEILLKQRDSFFKYGGVWLNPIILYFGCIIGGVIADLLFGRFNTLLIAFLSQALGVIVFNIPVYPQYEVSDVRLTRQLIFVSILFGFSNGFSRMNLIIVLIHQLPLRKCFKDSTQIVEPGNISSYFILFLLVRDSSETLAQYMEFNYRIFTPFVMLTLSIITFYMATISYPFLLLQNVEGHFKFINFFGEDQYEIVSYNDSGFENQHIPNLGTVTQAPQMSRALKIYQFKIVFKWFVWLAAYCTFFGTIQIAWTAICYTNISLGKDLHRWPKHFNRFFQFLPSVFLLAVYVTISRFRLNKKLTPHFLLGISYLLLVFVLLIAIVLETLTKISNFSINMKDQIILNLLYMTMNLSLAAAYEIIYRKSEKYATALTIGFFEFSTVFGTLLGKVLYVAANSDKLTAFSNVNQDQKVIPYEKCPSENDSPNKNWVQQLDCGHLEKYFLVLLAVAIVTFAVFCGFTLFNTHYYIISQESIPDQISRQSKRKNSHVSFNSVLEDDNKPEIILTSCYNTQ